MMGDATDSDPCGHDNGSNEKLLIDLVIMPMRAYKAYDFEKYHL